jgi:hypothetical protein
MAIVSQQSTGVDQRINRHTKRHKARFLTGVMIGFLT